MLMGRDDFSGMGVDGFLISSPMINKKRLTRLPLYSLGLFRHGHGNR
jgi:hypothetical protein